MSTTARDLAGRLWLLLALGAVTTVALFGAYRGVHADAVPLSSSSASGVLAVDTAKYALARAQEGALRDAAGDGAGTGDFHTQISVANVSLARAAADDVTGLTGRQTLQTVVGLISVYSGLIENAAQQPRNSPLRDAFTHYAQSLLGTDDASAAGTPSASADSSVMGRLNALQHEQLAVVDRQTSFGPLLWLGWGLALALCVALLAALVEAHRFSRARFRRRWNRPLGAAAVLLVAGAAVLALFTRWTHAGMADSRAELRRPLTGTGIHRAGTDVAGHLAGVGFRAAAAGWIPAGGAVLMLLIALGLLPRINEYRFRSSR